MRHDRDFLWKGLMEDVFVDFLRFVFPAAEDVFDLNAPIYFLEQELRGLSLGNEAVTGMRRVDKLAQVMGRDGNNIPGFYVYECMSTRLKYEFYTLRVLDYTDEELVANPNPFALVMLIAKQALLGGKDFDARLLQGKLFIFRNLYRRGSMQTGKLQAILRFLNNYVQFSHSETQEIFKKEINYITQKKDTMNLAEALEIINYREGKREATREIIINLVKTGKLSIGEIAKATKTSEKMVEKIRLRIKN